MLSDEVLEKVTERIVERLSVLNTNILKHIGSKLDEIGTLKPTQAQQLVQTLKYGGDYEKIVKELARVSKLNTKEIKEIFEEVAKNDYRFAEQFYDYRGIGYIPFEENIALQNEVKAIANITARRCAEMMTPRALGFGMIDKRTGEVTFKGLKQAYYDLLDEAVLSVSQGKESFDQAMTRQIKQMGSGGLKVIYESTYINKEGKEVHNSRRLDSAIRMNLKDSLRELHNETQAIFGEEFNADGVEISVHGNPAPDHAEVQGKQFSNDEFDKFQNDELAISYDGIEFEPEFDGKDRRAISEYNCYHYTFSIVLGVSKPEYSNEELKKIIDDNNKGFDLDGKHYTLYEGTQLQRRLETEIRKEKDTQIMAKEAGQQDVVQQSQQRITQLTNKYKELSKVSGLPTRMDRMKVSGYTLKGRTKLSNNLLAYNKNNDSRINYIGNINLNNNINVNKRINEYRSNILPEKEERAYIIDKNGEIFKVKGHGAVVNLPDWLDYEDSIVIHNHPEEDTHYSFSREDVDEFLSKKMKKLYGDDTSYQYVIERKDNTIDNPKNLYNDWHKYYANSLDEAEKGNIDIELDGNDYILKELSKDYNFKYDRKRQTLKAPK